MEDFELIFKLKFAPLHGEYIYFLCCTRSWASPLAFGAMTTSTTEVILLIKRGSNPKLDEISELLVGLELYKQFLLQLFWPEMGITKNKIHWLCYRFSPKKISSVTSTRSRISGEQGAWGGVCGPARPRLAEGGRHPARPFCQGHRKKQLIETSVADPHPGIRCLFGPWIRDRYKSGSGSGMNNPDHISESIKKQHFFLVKIIKFFDVDPGWKKVWSDPQHC